MELPHRSQPMHWHVSSTARAWMPATAGDAKGQYKGVIDCFAKTLQHDGLKAFYSGFMTNFARMGSWNVCMFLTLEQVLPSLCQLFRAMAARSVAHKRRLQLSSSLRCFPQGQACDGATGFRMEVMSICSFHACKCSCKFCSSACVPH